MWWCMVASDANSVQPQTLLWQVVRGLQLPCMQPEHWCNVLQVLQPILVIAVGTRRRSMEFVSNSRHHLQDEAIRSQSTLVFNYLCHLPKDLCPLVKPCLPDPDRAEGGAGGPVTTKSTLCMVAVSKAIISPPQPMPLSEPPRPIGP